MPTRFLKSWIESHYNERILAAIEAEIGGVASIAISVRSSTSAAPEPASASPAKLVVAAKPLEAVRAALAPRAFRSAAAAAAIARRAGTACTMRRSSARRSTAGSPSPPSWSGAPTSSPTPPRSASPRRRRQPPAFSPLYVHAAVGLGKTHLLQAIAHAAVAQGSGSIYLTAERFMYGFVAALQSQTAIAFKEALRSIDLLIFDDAQFLQGKAIQNEFGHALNALLDAGRQVVVAADRPPGDLEVARRARALAPRRRPVRRDGRARRAAAGEDPRSAHRRGARAEPAFRRLAGGSRFRRAARSSRTGAISKARSIVCSPIRSPAPPLTVEAAEIAIRDLIRAREPKRVKIEDIQKLVASHYSVTRADILSSRRTATVVKPRQVAMYLSKALTLRSLPEIGRRFGGRDHTTVLHAVRKIEGLTASDSASERGARAAQAHAAGIGGSAMALIFKIVGADEWRAAEAAGVFAGSAVDRADGYIHFSTAEQAPRRRRNGSPAATISCSRRSRRTRSGPALRWEPSRGGALFPHLYAPSGARRGRLGAPVAARRRRAPSLRKPRGMTRALSALALPLLPRLPPETAHRAAIGALKFAPLPPAARRDPRLKVHAFGLDFPNPLGMAAGFDKNARSPRRVARARLRLCRGRHADAAPADRQSRARGCSACRPTKLSSIAWASTMTAMRRRARASRRILSGGIVGVNFGPNKDAADRLADYRWG